MGKIISFPLLEPKKITVGLLFSNLGLDPKVWGPNRSQILKSLIICFVCLVREIIYFCLFTMYCFFWVWVIKCLHPSCIHNSTIWLEKRPLGYQTSFCCTLSLLDDKEQKSNFISHYARWYFKGGKKEQGSQISSQIGMCCCIASLAHGGMLCRDGENWSLELIS